MLAMDESNVDAKLRRQIEYYFSDRNLARDAFFRDLVMATSSGWVDLASFKDGCNRLKALDADETQIASVLRTSSELEVEATFDQGICTSCRIRRKRPFTGVWSAGNDARASAGNNGRNTNDQGKGKGKGDKGKGTSSAEPQTQVTNRTGGAVYMEDESPCGYYLAGCCQYGTRCHKCHSTAYALAIREDWLHPGNPETQESLRAAAYEALGKDAVEEARLFPRVFSRRLDASTKTTAARANGGGNRRWNSSSNAGASAASRVGGQAVGRTPKYILVFDLEGKNEIIEFPLIVIDTHLKQEVGRFQRFVRPAKLFEGETLVPDAPGIPFQVVLEELSDWLNATIGRRLEQLDPSFALFLTCGDWDCKHVHTQCKISEIARPPAIFAHWINIKRTYSQVYGGDFRGMKSMLARLGMLDAKGNVRYGFHHLGMHDVENICYCLLHLLKEGHEVLENGIWYKPS